MIIPALIKYPQVSSDSTSKQDSGRERYIKRLIK